MNQKPHISPSAMDMFLRCGEQYRRRYVLGERIPPGIALVKGGGVHHAAEVNYRQKIESHTDLDDKVLCDAARDHIHHTVAAEGLMLAPDEVARGVQRVRDEAVDRAVALTREFRRTVAPQVQPVVVEEFVRVVLPKADRDLLGRIDCVDSHEQIRDLKTASRRKSEDEVQRSDQLTFYHVAYAAKYGKPPAGVVMDVLLDQKLVGTQRLASQRTEGDKKVFLARLNAALAGIRAGNFQPAPLGTWWCSPRFCGYWHTCPFVNAARAAAADSNDPGPGVG